METVEARTLPEQPTAVRRTRLRPEEIPSWIGETYARVAAYLGRTGSAPVGPPFARYVLHEHDMGIEAGFPVAEPVTGDGEVEAGALPAGPAVVALHVGDYDGLAGAYRGLVGWLQERGREPAGAHWEVYLSDPRLEPDSSRWRTEMVLPYVDREPRAPTG